MFLFNEPFVIVYQNAVVVNIVIVCICTWSKYYSECSFIK